MVAGLLVLISAATAVAQGFADGYEGAAELAMLCLLSMAVIAIVCSLLFDAVGLSLTATTWVVTFVVLTWAACVVAPTRRGVAWSAPRRFSPAAALVLAAALLVAGGAVWLGTRALPPPKGLPGYTILSEWPVGNRKFSVLVTSRETSRVSYRLSVSRKSLPAISRTLELRPGQRYRLTVSLPAGAPRHAHVSLYRIENGVARRYRQVNL